MVQGVTKSSVDFNTVSKMQSAVRPDITSDKMSDQAQPAVSIELSKNRTNMQHVSGSGEENMERENFNLPPAQVMEF